MSYLDTLLGEIEGFEAGLRLEHSKAPTTAPTISLLERLGFALSAAASDCAGLRDRVAHLEGLIKQAEAAGDFCDEPACPWCLTLYWKGHATDCQTFASKGVLR